MFITSRKNLCLENFKQKLTVIGEPLKQQDKLQSIVSNTDEIDIESQMDSSSNIISSKESIDDDVIVRPEFEGNWEITWNKVGFGTKL